MSFSVTEWQVEEKEAGKPKVKRVFCETEGLKFLLYSPSDNKEGVIYLKEELYEKYKEAGFPNKVLLQEWEDYRLKLKPDEEGARVFCGDVEVQRDEEGFYPLKFQNRLGRVLIKVKIGGKLINLPEIEVVSSKLKYNEPESVFFYPRFYINLVEDLKRELFTMPFYFYAPTHQTAVENLKPPSLLFIFHFLKQNYKRIIDAFNIVLNQPYKRLCDELIVVDISKAKMVDHDMLNNTMVHPGRWERTSRRMVLADKLGGYLPKEVLQRYKYETYDVPENRFVKFFCGRLLQEVDKVLAIKDLRQKGLEETVEGIKSLRDYLLSLYTTDFFQEVEEMQIFPASSTVLQRREGYRELLQLYREFLVSYIPIFDEIEEAISSRDVATLYEYWCFFKILEILGSILGKPKITLSLKWEGGLWESKTKAEFNNNYELIYNELFKRAKGGSYSVSLRPDYVLKKDGKPIIGFDAKFRFEESDIGDVEGKMEEIFRKGDMGGAAKLVDIYKMHTYKDALGLKFSILLYPGTKWCLYGKTMEKETPRKYETKSDFERISPHIEGVGYVPLVPGVERELEFKQILKNLIALKEEKC